MFAVLQCLDEIVGGFFAHAFQAGQGVGVQAVQVGDVVDEFFVDQLFDQFVAESFDVHGAPRGEVFDGFLALRFAVQAASAACDGFAFHAFDV